MSDMLRITGMSGIDTETMIKQLMKAENMKVDSVKQDRQYVEWQRDAYREITNLLRGFQDEYFNVTNPTKDLMSSSTFNSFKALIDGEDTSSYFNATVTSSAIIKDYSISSITTAKASVATSAALTNEATGINSVTNVTIESGKNDKIIVNYNGISKEIVLDAGVDRTINDLKTDLEAKIDTVFGTGKIDVDIDVDKLKFSAVDTGQSLSIKGASGNSGLTAIGFTDFKSANLEDIASYFKNDLVPGTEYTGADGQTYDMKFDINGQTFEFSSQTHSLNDIISTVNGNADAEVNMKYDEMNNKIVLESTETGASSNITFSDSVGNFTGVLGLTVQSGTDAVLEFSDGTQVTRSTNNFDVNGINFDLKQDYSPGTDLNLSIQSDTSGAVEVIKGFVEKYNEIISTINGKTSEKKYYDYKPLTKEQKDDMSEDDIKLWEEKAKSGLLRSDSTLQKIANDMRSLLYEKVDGVGISLYDIGIKTSTEWRDKGKLVIDETKLKKALEEKPQEVIQLFTKESDTIEYSDFANRNQRYSSEGLANRLNDVLKDNIRITNVNGSKGVLLEKAGIQGDGTEFDNILFDSIKSYDLKIAELEDDLIDKEDYYYRMFSRMESAIAEMNNQSSWLMSQLGSM